MGFLRAIWRILVAVKDALALLFLLLFFGILYAALSMRPVTAAPSGSALTLDLDGVIVDQLSERDAFTIVSQGGGLSSEIRLRDVVDSVHAAATDDRIKAMVLDLDGFMGAGQGHLQSVGGALRSFRAAGKPIYAFATAYTDDSYYLASYATEIWTDPLGGVIVTGPGGNNLYFKGLLDKLGVTIELFKVGQFKAAVEPMTRADQSPEAKQAAQALADTLWKLWLSDVVRARPGAKIDTYLGDLPGRVAAAKGDLARAGADAGLIDHVGHRSDFARRIAKLVGDGPDKRADQWNGIHYSDYAQVAEARAPTSGAGVGVIHVAGDIVDGEAMPGTAGGDTIAGLINEALTRDEIKALVVRIDSPGGSATASEKIRHAVMGAKRRKLPVVVSMGSLAASGGYWVATAGDVIYAQPATITGSIGVFAIIPTFENVIGKAGLSADGVATTPYSGEPDLLGGISPETRQLLQLSVENIYGRFLGLVSRSREITPERAHEIGQGRVWSGATARQIGLVDRFGSLDDAIAEAARRAGLPKDKPRVIQIEQAPSLPIQLLSQLLGGTGVRQAIHDPWGKIAAKDRLMLIGAMRDARAIMAGPAIQTRCLECASAGGMPDTGHDPLVGQILKWLDQRR